MPCRPSTAIVALVLAATGLASCSTDAPEPAASTTSAPADSSDAAASATATEASPAPSRPSASSAGEASATPSGRATSAADAYPVDIPTTFGDVTVEAEPERVVALGWGDAETALALGVEPVGASDWLSFGGDGVGPWAEGLYTESPEIIGTLEPSYEAIAALQPDLILDVKSSGDQERHDQLSSIATTVGVPADNGDDYLTTTEQQVEMIAAALGRSELGDELLAELDQAFEVERAAHPEWEGQTVTVATRTSETWGAYIEGSERVEFMKRLGFVQNPQVAALPTSDTGFSVDLSNEQVPLFDADLVVAFPIFIETSQMTDDALWQALPAVEDGRAVVIDGELSSAYSLSSVLSTQYAIDNLVPLVEDATG